MKNNQLASMYALCTILIGALKIACPETADTTLVTAIGILFLCSGIASLLAFLKLHHQLKKQADQTEESPKTKRAMQVFYPIVGIGCFLFGLVLVIIPNTFVSMLLYLLGGFIILASIIQIIQLLSLRKVYSISPASYIIAGIILACGVAAIIFNYTESYPVVASYIFGGASIVYGISEIIYLFWFRNNKAKKLPTA